MIWGMHVAGTTSWAMSTRRATDASNSHYLRDAADLNPHMESDIPENIASRQWQA
jgi:hypothetical protein